ncbi:MAG TPA: hypothetical protein GX506_05795 [Firmicutes bacterium]|nr:hypothetical protein [Bacillota bacterium]
MGVLRRAARPREGRRSPSSLLWEMRRLRFAVTLYGTMGWIPSDTRETACVVVETPKWLLIVDLGTGFRRFLVPPGQDLLKRYNDIFIFLSHFHLDHSIGLTYVPFVLKGKKVRIAGPGSRITGRSLEENLASICRSPIFSTPLDRFPMELELIELEPGVNTIGDLEVKVRVQPHTDPSVGLVFNNELAYITDTSCTEDTTRFVDGVRILMHETWFDSQDYERISRESDSISPGSFSGHSHAPGVSQIAQQAGVHLLLPVHLNPAYSDTRIQQMEQYLTSVLGQDRIRIPRDLDRFHLL